MPREFNVAGYLGVMGVNYKPSSAESFENKAVYLTAGNARYFTKEELIKIRENNCVILDGAGAQVVFEKGCGEAFGIESVEVIPSVSGVKSYEQIENDIEIYGIKGYRSTAQEKVGDYYKITYCKDMEAISGLYNRFGERVGNGMVKMDNCFIMPYDTSYIYQTKGFEGWWGDWYSKVELFSELRKVPLQQFLLQAETDTPFIFTDYTGVGSFFYQKDNGVAIFVNSTVHHLDDLKVWIKNIQFQSVFVIDRATGEKRKVEYQRNGNQLIIFDPLLPMTTKTVIFA